MPKDPKLPPLTQGEAIAKAYVKERDTVILTSFCEEGEYLGEGGKMVKRITCAMPSEEFLAVIHEYDQKIIEAAAGRYE